MESYITKPLRNCSAAPEKSEISYEERQSYETMFGLGLYWSSVASGSFHDTFLFSGCSLRVCQKFLSYNQFTASKFFPGPNI